jgi:hypothetical protein
MKRKRRKEKKEKKRDTKERKTTGTPSIPRELNERPTTPKEVNESYHESIDQRSLSFRLVLVNHIFWESSEVFPMVVFHLKLNPRKENE